MDGGLHKFKPPFVLDMLTGLTYIAETLILFKEMQYGKDNCGKDF